MRKIIHNILFILAFLSAASVNGLSQTYYVSTSGYDSNPGTLASPFLTIAKAVSVVKAGETIFVRGGSDMADAGVDVGLTYAGSAPDLGCFETGLPAISDIGSPGKVVCYPNPVTDIGYIKFTAERAGRCEVRLFDITGRYVRTITDKNIDPGENIISFNLSDTREGLYIYRLSLNNTQLFVGRIIRLSSSH